MKEWYFPYSADRLNDATAKYVETIEVAGNALGVTLRRVNSIGSVPRKADVLVMDCKTATNLVWRRPRCRYWLWIQGVSPEEVELEYGSKLRKGIWTIRERLAIPRAKGTLMVSGPMRTHYMSKYAFRVPPVFLMPCVNMEWDASGFVSKAARGAPTFVYAGSMHAWQCFDLTLEVFRLVKSRLPGARLDVLTGDGDVARDRVRAAGVSGVSVAYVPLSELGAALRTYKYGFVLRRSHVVNAVATPTKVGSYMASGVVPIMTSAVTEYAERLGGLDTVVMTEAEDALGIARAILEFEEQPVSPESMLADYSRLFEEYFDHSKYVPRLAEFLARTGLGADTSGR